MARLLVALLLAACSGIATAGSFPGIYTNPIVLDVQPSRTSGKEPLCVLFDASATTSPAATNPFLEIQHSFDSGDAAAGNYSYGNPNVTARGVQTGGPVYAYCYPAGTYTFTDTAYDGSNSSVPKTITITASAYTGAETKCYANGAAQTPGVNKCPADAAASQGSVSQFSTILADMQAGTYHNFILKAGDSFTASSQQTLNVNCSAAGGCAIQSSVAGSTVTIDGSANTGNVLSFNLTSNDIRLVDVTVAGRSATAGTNCVAASGSGTINRITFLRFNCTGAPYGGWVFGSGDYTGTTLANEWAIVDSTVQGITGCCNTGHTALFFETSKFMFMGNSLDGTNNGDGALQRNQYLGTAFIAHNTYQRAPNTKNTVALAAPPFSTTGVYSQYVVFADNELQPNGNTALNLGNHDSREEWLRQFVVERNWFHTNPNGVNGMQGGGIFYGAIRNNIIDLSGSNLNDQKGIIVTAGTVVDGTNPADHIYVYNNTVYTSTCTGGAGCTFRGIYFPTVTPAQTNVYAKNNLVVGPNTQAAGGFPKSVDDPSNVCGSNCTNNSTDTPSGGQVKTPGFSFQIATPLVPSDFKPVCSSTYPCAQGTSVPVWSDYFLVSEPATRDLGAVVH